MIYLLTGDDLPAKDQKIAHIKKKTLGQQDALSFDYESLDGHKLDASALKKALLALPALAAERVVVIRSAEKLSAQNKEIVLKFTQEKNTRTTLILECEGAGKNAFFNALGASAQTFHFPKGIAFNIFNVTKALERRNSAEALKVLAQLLAQGDHPLQLMGGLTWFWENSRTRISDQNFRRGLRALQEADLNIKRSRLTPEQAIEVAIVKLTTCLD